MELVARRPAVKTLSIQISHCHATEFRIRCGRTDLPLPVGKCLGVSYRESQLPGVHGW